VNDRRGPERVAVVDASPPRPHLGPLGRLVHATTIAGQVLYWTVTFQLVGGLRLRKYARMIRRSLLLDPEFYLGQCGPDRSARLDPFMHYLTKGAGAGLNPNPLFDTRLYLERNPDVAAAGKNPLVHYIRYGSREGRAPSAFFDGASYVERYPDVLDSGWPSPLVHYLRQGQSEGRNPLPSGDGLVPDLLEWTRDRDPSRATRVLVVDGGIPSPELDPGSRKLLAVIRILREDGLTVTYAADADNPRLEEGTRLLAALGVEVVAGRDTITSHLITFGHLYGTALLSRPVVARRYMPLVRGHAPWAKVVYVAPGDAATRDQEIERLDAAAADLTLAVTADECDSLDLLRERVRKLVQPEHDGRTAPEARSST
jgi:hypothetical protein